MVLGDGLRRNVKCTHQAIDGSRPSVARGGADDCDALVATGEEVLKEVSEGLEAWTEASGRAIRGQREDSADPEAGLDASRFGWGEAPGMHGHPNSLPRAEKDVQRAATCT
jgi:hypothetical protein